MESIRKMLFSKYKWLILIVMILGVSGIIYKFWPSQDPDPELPMLVEIEAIQEGQLIVGFSALHKLSNPLYSSRVRL